MKTYKVTTLKPIECLTQPVNGNKSGQWMQPNSTFESETIQNNWVKVADKRWISLSSCIVVTGNPPPDPDPDPPPVETFTPPAEIMARWVIGLDATGAPIYSDYYYYFIEPA